MVQEYGPLFERLETLKGELSRRSERGGETAEFLTLRKRVLTLELEITELRLRELEAAPAPAPAEPAPGRAADRPMYTFAPPPAEPASSARPAAAPGPEPGQAARPGTAGRYTYVARGARPQARPAPPPRPSHPPGPGAVLPGRRGGSLLGMTLTESSVGKYILSLLAALLILLGCCVLILMGWGRMTRLVKAAVIALGGAGFLAAGLGLGKRLPKPFSDSLTACGMGVLYADVIALYQAWALVPLWGALLLVLAWDGACLLLGRRGRTRVFFYVLALGNLITAALVCQLISNSPLSALSLLFVGLTQAGAILAFRRVYGRFDPALVLSAGAAAIYVNLAHYGAVHHWWRGYVRQAGGWMLLCLALCLVLSWLLLWSAGRVVERKRGGGARAVYLCLTIPLLLSVFPLGEALGYYAALAASSPALGFHLTLLLACAGAAGLLLPSRFRWEGYCILAPVALLSAERLGCYYGLDAAGTGLAALAALAVYTLRPAAVSRWVCAAAYGAYLLALLGLHRPAPYYLALVPGLLLPAWLVWLWRDGETRRRAWGALLCTDAAALVLLRGVWLEVGINPERMAALWLLLALAGLLAALPAVLSGIYRKWPALAQHGRIQDLVYEGLLLFYALFQTWSGPWLRALCALLLFLHGLKLLYLAYFRWEDKRPGWGLTAAALLTLNVLQAARLTPAGDWPILLSLLCIALAAGYVVLGFHRKTKPLRLFGLVLSIASVVKMVTLDVVGSPSLYRVAALIAGGLLCFGISFVYNWVEQRQAKKETFEKETTP